MVFFLEKYENFFSIDLWQSPDVTLTRTKKISTMFFKEPGCYSDSIFQSRRERDSARNSQICTIIAVVSVCILIFTFAPFGCPQYAGGPRTSLASAMANHIAPEGTAPSHVEGAPNFDGEDDEPKIAALLQSEEEVTVIVYAPWCGHCKNFMKTVDELRKKLPAHKRKRVITVNGDNAQNRKLMAEYKIEAFPTVLKKTGDSIRKLPHQQNVMIDETCGEGIATPAAPPAAAASDEKPPERAKPSSPESASPNSVNW